MKVVLLAGGFGTRLRPYTFSIPKPLLPFGDKPIIEHAIDGLKAHGATHLFVSVGHMSEIIKAFCRDGRQWGLQVEYLEETKPLGTAGPLSLLRSRLAPDESLILMNGDIVTDFSFSKLMDHHIQNKCGVTLAYARIVTRSAFGVVEVKDGKLVNVREKPETTQLVSAGIYAISARSVAIVPDSKFYTMPDLMAALVERGDTVGAFPIDGYWRGLETREDIDDALAYLNESCIDSPTFDGND